MIVGEHDEYFHAESYRKLNPAGHAAPWGSLTDSHAVWARWNGCAGTEEERGVGGRVLRTRGCPMEVHTYVLDGVAHVDAPMAYRYAGRTGGEVIWDFLRQYPRRTAL